MIPEKECRKSWNCPSDRELKLRAKLNAGWSVHSANFLHKIEPIPPSELQSIENVIRRAQELEQMEVERVGRMLCRIENMTRNAMGDGKNTCSMCGMAFGLFRSSFVYCSDCAKAVCEKCRVDTCTLSLEICMLCKICAENREIWKKSGGWFYGRFPTLTEDCQQERISQISASPGPVRGYNTWSHRAPDIVRLESFEPPEENHNENSSYKDWSMSSTPRSTDPPSRPEDEPIGPPSIAINAPDLCRDAKIDAITRTQSGTTYAFKGNFYWKVHSDGGIIEGFPRRISDDWGGLEGDLDASFTWSDGKTYFFKGRRYWLFTGKKMDTGYPRLLSVGFEGIPGNLDAAVVWNGNGKPYFFKGAQYWRYDSDADPPVNSMYPLSISEWKGVPYYIDAAVRWDNNKTYFFKGDKYYRYNDMCSQVDVDPQYPLPTSVHWFGCKSVSNSLREG